MIRYFLILFLIILSAPIAVGKTKATNTKEKEFIVNVAGVPAPKPKLIKKRVKWWNIYIYKNMMPIQEISEYSAYLKTLQQQATQYKAHEEALKKPRAEWVKYYTDLEAYYQKTMDIMATIIQTRIQHSRVAGSIRPENVKVKEAAEAKLKQLCKDFRKSVVDKPSRPE